MPRTVLVSPGQESAPLLEYTLRTHMEDGIEAAFLDENHGVKIISFDILL